MDKKALIKKMKEYTSFKEKDVEERTLDVKEMSLTNLRDSLIGLGTILDEDLELNSYIISVSAGVANMNGAIVAVQLDDGDIYLLGYAREGLINQHTARKAMDKVEKRVSKYLK